MGACKGAGAWAGTAKSACLLRSLNLIYGLRELAGAVEANNSSRWTETTDRSGEAQLQASETLS